jgi:4-hydroxyphenylacetate 3-monooxygenase
VKWASARFGGHRVRLFRLAWDTCLSAFAGRQSLYEYFFFGDPVRMAGALVASYDREPYKARVSALLAGDEPVLGGRTEVEPATP